jgi:Bacterial SH3 domain
LGESFPQSGEIDLDKLFSENVTSEIPKAPSQAQLDLLPGADEDWLAQLHTSVGEVSASALVRQQEDRPVEELSERLQKLRQRTEELPEATYTDAAESLSPVEAFVPGSPGLGQDIVLTAEQQKQVELLRALVPSDNIRQDAARMSAIEATYDSPYMPGLEDTPEVTLQPAQSEKAAKPKRRARRRRRLNIRFDRYLVALILAAAVILPFIVPGFRIGSLPPASFAAGSSGQTAFDQIEGLEAGDLVLVGVEYGAAAAAELDGMTDALLRHIILRSAFPILISSNPVGLLRSEARMTAISQDIDFLRRIGATQPLSANSDYYIVRYLPGSVIGLRAFSGDTANLLLADIHGQATNLVVRSMSDFALVTVITDRAEDLRAYAEQIAPLTRAPLVSAVSYGASPLVEPYASTLTGGLLIGYADAYTYGDLLDTVEARSISQRVRIVPTLEPPTQPAAGQSGGENSTDATQPALRATGIRATPTLAVTPAPILDTATVIALTPVNMRIGPGTENPVLASIPSGAVLPVLGYNADRSWVNVLLEDGRSGWISESLLSISEAQSAAPKLEIYGKRQEIDEGEETTPTPPPSTATRIFPTFAQTEAVETTDSVAATEAPATATPRPTRTALPSATATERPTAEATPEPTVEVTEAIAAVSAPPLPPSPGYRDERWYAMNLGVIASAVIITLGMVINLVRGLLRRGQRA